MRIASILFHKNAESLYKKEWITQCVKSIEYQTYKDFDLWEMNYGNEDIFYTKGTHIKADYKNHIYALNRLLDHVFSEGYDACFINNIDDFSDISRYEIQLSQIDRFDLISCNFQYIGGKRMLMTNRGDIRWNLNKGHNVICHPGVLMSKTFWGEGFKYDVNCLGFEDLELWQRAINHGKKIYIAHQILVNYRIHDKQISAK